METCKKCGRNLPEGYKHKVCPNCMGKDTDKLKKAGKNAGIAVGLAGAAASIAAVAVKLAKFVIKK